MKRNLRFWTRFTWENLEAALLAMAIFAAVSIFYSECIWSRGVMGLEVLPALAPIYLIISAAFSLLLIIPGCQMLYIPLLLSHGEPRKNVFWGFQYYRFLFIGGTAAASGLVWLLIPGEISRGCLDFLPMISIGLVAVSSVANLIGSAYVMKLKWVNIIIIGLCSVCGGLFGWLGTSGIFDISEILQFIPDLSAISPLWQLAAVSAALLAADMGVQWLLLRRREVKF